MSITAMKAALEALQWNHYYGHQTDMTDEPRKRDARAIIALRAAISEQEKCEPVGYARYEKDKLVLMVRNTVSMDMFPIYAHPAPVPAGWQLVPVEPTEEMKVAGSDALGVYHCGSPSDIYKAMKQAAPKPGESHD